MTFLETLEELTPSNINRESYLKLISKDSQQKIETAYKICHKYDDAQRHLEYLRDFRDCVDEWLYSDEGLSVTLNLTKSERKEEMNFEDVLSSIKIDLSLLFVEELGY